MLAYKPVDVLHTGVFFDVKADAPIIVGQMTGKCAEDGHALMICAADDPHDRACKTFEITMRAPYTQTLTAYRGAEKCVLLPDADGVYHIPVSSCGGVLVTAKSS